MHATTHQAGDDKLETPEDGSAVQEESGRGGGVDTEITKRIQVEEETHSGWRIGGPHVSDAHAGERSGKRVRTSTPSFDADSTAR